MQWHFGPFRLDLANTCLWRAEQPVPLRPKTFDLLAYMVTHAGQLVTKEAILDAVWPETAVGDGVLKTSMGELRKALRETVKAPQWIATVHGRGYRFVALVTVVDLPETPHPGEPPQRAVPAPFPQGTLPPAPDVLVPQEGTDAWRCAVCQHPQSRATRFCRSAAPRGLRSVLPVGRWCPCRRPFAQGVGTG
jgi:DNA-binding winged helix-turn-helix (wHTH) protein